jgi:probable addiction module antidote protein
MTRKTHPFDPAKYLDNDEAIAAYIDAALEEDDGAGLADALGVVARARGMTQVARDAGVARESLYKSLSADGNPSVDTLLRVMKALRLKLSVSPSLHTPAKASETV